MPFTLQVFEVAIDSFKDESVSGLDQINYPIINYYHYAKSF